MKRSLSLLVAGLSLSAGLSLMSCAGAGDDFGVPGSGTATPTATATGSGTPAPISFANDVFPIFTGQSCNNGTSCHGVGGAGIVILGATASAAYSSISTTSPSVLDISATPATAETSLLLCTPLAGGCNGSHSGGFPFASTTNADYVTILTWIEQGALNN